MASEKTTKEKVAAQKKAPAKKKTAAPKAAPEKKVTAKSAPVAPKKTTKKATSLAHGVGRRKRAVARVWLKKGSGVVVVNEKDINVYFDTDVSRLAANKTLTVVPDSKAYDIQITVNGGGLRAQAGAVQLGIARAFLVLDESLKALLREHNLLTVDARKKERKKYGQRGARRKFQFVKR